jgi:predicted regulator of Ras-like GTPase activity (Roadblock/LC7/MglB family)
MEMSQRKNGKRLVFSEKTYHKIGQILTELLKQSQSQLCLFADMNGYPITHSGEAELTDIFSLTALAAGDFSATAEMAKIIGGEERFRFIYHEGAARNVYLCNVGDNYLLLIVFTKNVALGMVRILAQRTVERLVALLAELKQESDNASRFIDDEFRSMLGQQLDSAFGGR